MRLFLSIFILTTISIQVKSQDSIKVEPSIYYNSSELPHSRIFAGSVEYALEKTIHPDSSISIDYCYYLDSIRKCKSFIYNHINDSIIQISNGDYKEIWIYKKIDKLMYQVFQVKDNLKEIGFVSQIIPLTFTSTTYTISMDNIDTLWATKYKYSKHVPQGFPSVSLFQSNIKGEVYSSKNKIITIPKNKDNTPFTELEWKPTGGCYNDPSWWVNSVSFIITKEGRIKHIKQHIGNLDLGCSPVYLDLVKQVYRQGPFEPSTLKSDKINSEWIISIK